MLSGVTEGTKVVTTGAAALREGDRIVLLGHGQRGGPNAQGEQGRGGRGRGEGGGGRRGAPPTGQL